MNMESMSQMDIVSSIASMSMAMASMSSDMASMSMASAAASATPTAMNMVASAASAMASMDMGGMSMSPTATSAGNHSSHSMSGMGMGNGCKISMLWNWNTIDACFISSGWQITNSGMFAGTCIGVFFWVVAICLVQRLHREFDRYIYRQWAEKNGVLGCSPAIIDNTSSSSGGNAKNKFNVLASKMGLVPSETFRPNFWQQFVRACFFTIDFGAGYLLMLMAMYYNGYILITMWLGALFGYYFFAGDSASGNTGTPQKATCC
ncbi:Copper transport protein ctr4 [Wickerhamiella sorbophila]|uniref:Copper transport protein n=1 Tax=Wickerhamiella sorbophila TaxID=45607 RepID=A0A2T0FET2_9ASCO|nr:Copper transport protein ctr4 [Wickerhamiella sorbophila]PRT53501.1 Copper transport protein ctr4 [Wickerhamiella sorbophila]